MSGIPGQPAPKPSSVNSPVPGASSFDDFEKAAPQAAQSAGKAADSFDAFEAGGQAPPAPQGYNGPGAGALEMSANAAPTVGGIAGGTFGALAGGGAASIPGIAAMGMAGAAAGSAYKQFIMQSVLKRQPVQDFSTNLAEAKGEAGDAGVSTLAGLGVSKAAGMAMASKVGKASLDAIANVAAKPLAALKGAVDVARDEIFQPLEKIIASKVTPMTSEESGTFIKNQFASDIKNRFNSFVKSYADIDQVARALPLPSDDVKLAFSGAAREGATDLPSKSYNMVKGFADRFDQAKTGEDFYKVLSDLRAEATQAQADAVKYGGNVVRDHAAALNMFADKADAFMENKVIGGIAQRISKGTATMDEMTGFQRMMAAQQNPNVLADPKNLNKYMKSVANDYLDQRASVKAHYAQFRSLLEDVGESAKVSPEHMGPMQFVKAVQEVPSEKLADRMFDPKNAQALRTLQKQYPNVYEAVVKNKMSSIVASNLKLDQSIDYGGVAKALEKLPDGTGAMLMNPTERSAMLEAVNNPRLELLQKEHTGMVDKVATSLARIGEIMRTTGNAAGKASAIPSSGPGALMQQGVGRAANKGLSMMLPQQPQGPPQ